MYTFGLYKWLDISGTSKFQWKQVKYDKNGDNLIPKPHERDTFCCTHVLTSFLFDWEGSVTLLIA